MKRILSSLLCGCMIMGLMAGCGQTTASSTADNTEAKESGNDTGTIFVGVE